jgi:hypothetical protein
MIRGRGIFITCVLLCFAPGAVWAAASHAPPQDGFVLAGWGDWNVADADASVEEAHRVGARHISIMIQFCQDGKSASEVHWCNETPGTPFAATAQAQKVASLVAGIHERGMSFGLLPILFTGEGQVRQWTWPNDRSAWFESYGARMEELGRFASDEQATSLIVGSELTLLFVEDSGWRGVIRRVRAVYGGHLTISAVFAQFPLITFWDALDSIGISAYFPLTVTDDRFTDAQFLLNLSWRSIQATLEGFALLHGKPLMFVEVGYPNTEVAASRPWDYEWSKRKIDTDLARRCWEAFRNTWSHSALLRSFQIWALTTPAGDAADLKLFSPLHKPAEAVVQQLFKERAGL